MVRLTDHQVLWVREWLQRLQALPGTRPCPGCGVVWASRDILQNFEVPAGVLRSFSGEIKSQESAYAVVAEETQLLSCAIYVSQRDLDSCFQRAIIANPYPCTLDQFNLLNRVCLLSGSPLSLQRYARRFFNLLTSFERELRGPKASKAYPPLPTGDLSSCAMVIGPIRSTARVAAKPISLVCSSRRR